MRTLDEGTAELARQVLASEQPLLKRLQDVGTRAYGGQRIRCHGDYHLGQVLFTGRDFVIIDFEGEPARSLGERRVKRSPLRDAAGMLRSLHYVSRSGLHRLAETTGGALPIDTKLAEDWARLWYSWTAARFLGEYLEHARSADFLPASMEDIRFVLDTFVLDKALYEVAYELENRPEWVAIPLEGILEIANGLAPA
jgi:maltose alpha-D-glucosyltransferase/alpha-amylase